MDSGIKEFRNCELFKNFTIMSILKSWQITTFYETILFNEIPYSNLKTFKDFWKENLFMANVVVYSLKVCPYCVRAKQLLNSKDVKYQEILVDGRQDLLEEVMQKSGGRKTLPQIFIDDYHIGGFDDLYALEKEGKLDPLLGP